MIVKVKDTYINRNHVSLVALKPDNTLVVDLAYSKPEGPVFLVFPFDTKEEAEQCLNRLVGYDTAEVED